MRNKYRRKPVIVEAVQWDGNPSTITKGPDWLKGASKSGQIMVMGGSVYIRKAAGNLRCQFNDWIVLDVDGKICLVTPLNFEIAYEKVENDEQ